MHVTAGADIIASHADIASTYGPTNVSAYRGPPVRGPGPAAIQPARAMFAPQWQMLNASGSPTVIGWPVGPLSPRSRVPAVAKVG
jgi:hypothetical protein